MTPSNLSPQAALAAPAALATLATLAALAALAASPAARADSIDSLYDSEIVETAHRVTVEFRDGLAVYTITRGFENRGANADELRLAVDLPAGAVATGLLLRARGSWHAGALMHKDAARSAYDELTSSGRPRPTGPALLSWEEDGALSLHAFPALPGRAVTVRYTLEAPTCYARGLVIAEYASGVTRPLAEPSLHAPGARVMTEKQLLAALEVDALSDVCERYELHRGMSDDPRYAVRRAGPTTGAAVTYARRRVGGGDRDARAPGAVSGGDGPDVGDGDDGANEDGSDGSTAKFDASGTADIIELELSAARILEPAPRSARVVFVVDASRSQDETGVASQLALIRGYLAHVPDARFEVVVYRRHPQRLFGAFVPARDAARALAGVAPAMLRPGNGSHLDRGLLAAVDAVRSDRAGRSGTGAHPVRIVAFTDDRNRRAFTAEIAAGALARLTDGGASRDAVVHILRTTQRGGGNYEFSRDDEHELAPVAERTGGMFGRVQGDDAATAAAAMLGLVRPIQIDGLTLEVDGFALGGNDQDEDEDDRGDDPDDAEWAAERRRARIAEAFAVPDVFAEGRGYRRMLVVADSPRQVTVRGKIWGRPWKRTVAVHAGRSARLPGLVFGHTAWSDLPKTWLERIAREAGVVSPVTSLLARDGRDDPVSFPPPEILRGGISGYASCGCGGSVSIGTTCGGYGFLGAIDRAHKSVLLAAMLRPRIAACALAAGLDQPPPVALTVETTREEIVDVTPLEAPAAIRECAVDAAWSLVLDARFYEGRGAYRVTVR